MPSTLRLSTWSTPSCVPSETPSRLGLLRAQRPHTQAAQPPPHSTLTWCTWTHPPSTMSRFPAPHLPQGPCVLAPPLPSVSGRQLQLCSLLSEQVDSDAQTISHGVGTSFFLSLSSQPSSPCPLLLHTLLTLPSSPTSHISPSFIFLFSFALQIPKFPK